MKCIFRNTRCQVFLVILGAVSISCDESLPEYRNPAKVFEGKLSISYVLNPLMNALDVQLTVTNVYDETLDDRALLTGSMEIALAGRPEIKKTIALTADNLISAPAYDPVTGVLTIGSGQSITFNYRWDFTDDQGTNLPEKVFNLVADTTCKRYGRELAAEDLVIKGYLVVYSRTSPVVISPTVMSFCYSSIWVNTRECPPFTCN